MTTESPREQLMASAQIIETETRGHRPVSGFVKVIDRALVPTAPDAELTGFFPVTVPLDRQGRPTNADSLSALLRLGTGAVAIYPDRAVVGWTKGSIFTKVGSFSFTLDRVAHVKTVAFDDMPGVDVTLTDGPKLLLAFPSSKDGLKLTTSWRDVLRQLLLGEPATEHHH